MAEAVEVGELQNVLWQFKFKFKYLNFYRCNNPVLKIMYTIQH